MFLKALSSVVKIHRELVNCSLFISGNYTCTLNFLSGGSGPNTFVDRNE